MGCLIPNEYQEVEYIESTGTQYIDAGISIGDDNFSIHLKFSQVSRTSAEQPLASIWIREHNYWNLFIRSLSTGYYMDVFTGAHHNPSNTIDLDEIYDVSLTRDGDVWTLGFEDDVSWDYSPKTVNDTTLKIFARGDLAGISAHAKIYSLELIISDENTLNFIPCYRKSDNEIGMYDTVSKTFFTNQGTGTFLKGNDVYHSNVFDLLKTKRKIIMNQPHIETLSGDIVSFTTDMKAPLKECKVSFMPVQEGSGDPSPSNVRNITGWNGVSVKQCKKNLIIEDDPLNPNANYDHNSTGSTKYSEEEQGFYDEPPGVSYAAHATGKNGLSFNEVRLFIAPSDMTVVFSIEYKNVGTTYGIRLYKNSSRLTDIHGDADSTWHRYSQVISLSKGDYLKLIIYDKIYWRNIQVEIANSVIDYEPYQGTTYSIDWTDDAGTVYGGYVDLVSGELVQTYYGYTVDGVNIKANSAYKVESKDIFGAGIVYNIPRGKSANSYSYPTNIICNKLPVLASTSIHDIPFIYTPAAGALYTVFYVGKISEHSEITTNADRIDFTNAWLQENPVQLIYELAEPITYQLTPQQLITLKGQNNLWADTNGTTEIKFWKH